MAITNPIAPADLATRRATVRQLADEGHSARAIARRLGIHHKTVARDLAATPAPVVEEPTAPPAPVDAPPTAPPAPTSGARPASRLLHPLDPALIQDINVLADPRTGALPASLLRAIHDAAERRRATWDAMARRRAAAEERAAAEVERHRAHVAP
jgi:hypothetical protein